MKIPSADGFGNVVAAPRPRLQEDAPSYAESIGKAATAISLDLVHEQRITADAAERAKAVRGVNAGRDSLAAAHDEITEKIRTGEIPRNEAEAAWSQRSNEIRTASLQGVNKRYMPDAQADLDSQNARFTRGINKAMLARDQSEVRAGMTETFEMAQRLYLKDPEKAEVLVDDALSTFGPTSGMTVVELTKARQAWKEESRYNSLDTRATDALGTGNLDALRSIREQVQGPDGEALDPKKRNTLAKQIMGYERQVIADRQSKDSEARYGILSRTKDVQAMVLSGVTPSEGVAPTVEEYTKIHGANGPAIWQKEVGNYMQVGDALQQMRSASAADRNRLIQDATPGPGVGFADASNMREALVQAKALVEKQLVEDPAAYALRTSSRVIRAQQAMNQVLSNPNSPMEDRVAVMDFFARTTAAEQLRLGVDTVRDENAGNKVRGPRILTNTQANAIADQFNDQAGGGAKAALLVQGLEQQYGKWWPTVYQQLAQDNKLPPAALVIPNMSDPGARARLAAASVIKPEVLKEQLAPTDAKDIRDGLLSQFESARDSFASQGLNGTKTLSTFIQETEKLAMVYRAQGKSTGDAVKQAYTEVMGWKYEFHGSYRVPKNEMPKAVDVGARMILKNLSADELLPMTEPGLTEEDAKVLTLDAVKKGAQWITNGDETGLRLMLKGYDGALYQVKGKDGAPLDFTWARLRDAQVGPSNFTMERHVEGLKAEAARVEAARQKRLRMLQETGRR